MRIRDLEKLIDSHSDIDDLIKNVCDKKISAGAYREVYTIKDCRSYVIKIERDLSNAPFANVGEYLNFIENRFWVKIKPYLAECVIISNDGKVLVQTKIRQGDHHKFPKKIPSMFTDLKYQNFGWIGKRFVCCDYSFLKNVGFRMVKAKFWDQK